MGCRRGIPSPRHRSGMTPVALPTARSPRDHGGIHRALAPGRSPGDTSRHTPSALTTNSRGLHGAGSASGFPRGGPMTLTDPTFYRSPAEAIAAPTEQLAYVVAFDRAGVLPDALAVLDVDENSDDYGTVLGWA